MRQIPKWPSWQKDVAQNLINLSLKPEIPEASALNSSLSSVPGVDIGLP